jgi:formylglycine-generating enzyme required for sulfatase activity
MLTHNPPSRTQIFVAAATIALVAGCNSGSGDKPSSNPPGRVSVPAPAENDDAADQPAAAPKKPKLQVAKAEKTLPSQDPSVNPLDIFEVVPGEPKFELVQADGKPVSDDGFNGILPPKGVDSTKFDPPDSLKPPARQAAPPVTAASNPERPSSDREPSDRKTDSRKKSGRKTADHKLPDHKKAEQRKTDRKLAERKTVESQPTETSTANRGKTLPPGFSAMATAKNSPLGWPLRIRSDRDGAEMALVTGGAVILGHDGGPPESSPQLTVVIDSFYMDVNEVTLRQYKRFRTALKEERGRNIVSEPKNVSSPPNFPALGVTLTQAEFYARWAGKEIPTEAEWERAARGEAVFPHVWGNGRAIWAHARTQDEIDPVKSFRTDVSPFGIYDLAGNAREWCVDRYSPTSFADALKSSSGQLRNWKGPRVSEPENAHVVKGNGPNWDAWYRVGMDGVHSHAKVGFRCVLRLPEKDSSDK